MSHPQIDAEASEYLLVLMTTGTIEEARTIARALVDSRLAACVNILPQITSVFRWQDDVEEQDEVLLLAKTTQRTFQALCETVRRLHSYDVPEIIATSLEKGDAAYLKWISESVS